jgi:DNA-binding transcriptional regulator YiaG
MLDLLDCQLVSLRLLTSINLRRALGSRHSVPLSSFISSANIEVRPKYIGTHLVSLHAVGSQHSLVAVLHTDSYPCRVWFNVAHELRSPGLGRRESRTHVHRHGCALVPSFRCSRCEKCWAPAWRPRRTRRINLKRVAGYITRPPVTIKTALAHAPGPHQIFVEDALPRWHDPRDLRAAKTVPKLIARELARIREDLNLSRALLAEYLRTNVRTLENWEQRRAKPNAQAALLIRMVQRFPDTVHRLADI